MYRSIAAPPTKRRRLLDRPRWSGAGPAIVLASALATFAASSVFAPATAMAGPRDDMKAAYEKALSEANNLEYDAALNTINTAIQAAIDGGNADDPVLASLYLLRAALTYSSQGSAARDAIMADLKGAVILNYYVVVPPEMRSEDLTTMMQEARQAAGVATPDPITLRPPEQACDEPLHFEVLLSVPDGGTAALYWRPEGSEAEFTGTEMPAFSNVAEAELPPDAHQNANIEYFIYAFDASQNAVANLGLQEQPLVLQQACTEETPEETPEDTTPEDKTKKPKTPSALPRVWINLGFGTGFGVASGTAENTYRQFFPRGAQVYGPAEHGCAIARWVAGNGDLASR